MEEDQKDYTEDDLKKILKIIMRSVLTTAFLIIIFYFCLKRYSGLGAAFSKIRTVFRPIVIGFFLAFFMNPVMEFFQKGMDRFFSAKGQEYKEDQEDHKGNIIHNIDNNNSCSHNCIPCLCHTADSYYAHIYL